MTGMTCFLPCVPGDQTITFAGCDGDAISISHDTGIAALEMMWWTLVE